LKIFVTGASGFIGSHLCERLLGEGHDVATLMRQTNRMNYPSVKKLQGRVQFYYGSLADPIAVDRAIDDFRPEAVCALGAISPVAYSFEHPDEVTKTNYLGQVYLAESALRRCDNLKKFIFAGSMEEYGFTSKREPFVETDELRPACPYAVAKVATEKYLQYMHYAYKFPAICFRQTNSYGRAENDFFIVERAIVQMLQGNEINLGEPRPIRNFIHIDDLIDLYVAALKSDSSVHGEVFNTGPANGLSIEELVTKIADLIGWHGKINWHTRPVRAGEIFYLNSSGEKAKQMLDWEPQVSLADGLARTVEIWAENLGVKSVVASLNRGELLVSQGA
jgi:nucleoside-diphosphate-sugar epimerase